MHVSIRRIDRGLIPMSMNPELPALAPSAKIYVGFSGGLDSSVLLHLLASRFPERVHAVHVHHGLQALADDWAAHCAAFCASLQIPFTPVRVQPNPAHAAGPEAAARDARYAAFRNLMSAGDCLTTAHHRDDQAETVLLRLLRGSGVHGLAGIRPLTAFAAGKLWRPLLDVPRSDLRHYAESQRLRWVDDPHNTDSRYARSWLRADVMPALGARFPQAVRSLARSAALAAEAVDLLDELAAADIATAQRGQALSVTILLQHSAPRRNNLLRVWLRGLGFEVPSADELRRITDELLRAAPDAMPRLAWPGCELRRYRDLLFAMPPMQEVPAGWSTTWCDKHRLQLPADCGWLEAVRPPAETLTVRLPRAGEMFKPAGSGHTRSLKNLFQELGVPTWVRARTPVIEHEGAVAAVVGIGGSPWWEEHRDSLGAPLHWHHCLCGAASPAAL